MSDAWSRAVLFFLLTICFFNLACSCGGGPAEGHSVHPGAYACFRHVQLPPLRSLVWRQCFVCGLQRKGPQSHRHPGELFNPPVFFCEVLNPGFYLTSFSIVKCRYSCVYQDQDVYVTLHECLWSKSLHSYSCDSDVVTEDLLLGFNASDTPAGGDQILV